jgi:uncharacterized protein YbcI
MSPDGAPTSVERHGLSLLAQVSNEMVRVYKEQFGRGPTKARSYWCGDDVMTCVLEDTLTAGEGSLPAMGEHERLRDMRIFLQYASEPDFRGPVTRITGREITAFVSGIDTRSNGLSIETFVFAPRVAA